jgi:lipoprotein-releasing system permease protein
LNPQIFGWLDLLDTNVWVILILIACVAAFTMISGLLIIILERTRMIGILKALGYDNRGLRKVFLYIALFLTGKGLLWGNVIGLALCYVQDRWHLLRLDPENYYLEWVPISLQAWQVVAINVGTVALTLLVLVGPTAIIAKISPTRAIQAD